MENKTNFNRRSFLTLRSGNIKGTAAELTKEVYGTPERTRIRPPGAIEEKDFIIQCSRCNLCAEVCPHDAILFEDDEQGVQSGLPVIHPKSSPCLMCEEFPCIQVCEPKALLPIVEVRYPVIGKATFVKEHCLLAQGQPCDYCFRSCPKAIGAIKKGDDGLPVISESLCVGCGKCEYICVSMSGSAIVTSP